MRRFSERDLKRLSTALGALYAPAGIEEFPHRIVAALRELTWDSFDPFALVARRRQKSSPITRSLIRELARHFPYARRNAEFLSARANADRATSAIITIGADRRVRHCTDTARDLLRAHFPQTNASALPEKISRWIVAQRRVEPGLMDPFVPPTPLQTDSAHGALTVHYSPPDADGLEHLLLQEKRARGPERLCVLGLTLREAEVLYWSCKGKSNEDVGKILGIGKRTVEKHLESIFVKLLVETRSAANAIAIETLA